MPSRQCYAQQLGTQVFPLKFEFTVILGFYTKYRGIAKPGVVTRSVFKASSHYEFQLSPINISYADQGLVGFYLIADGSKVFQFIAIFYQ